MYAHDEILPFDGTLLGLADQVDLLKATMPKGVAFVQDSNGEILNRVKVTVQRRSDGSHTWDVELFHA